ncbi:MAG TPA: OsmC family protein [Pseudomonadales bacterium]|nr:OsmC family protein [Pseudomonadales bacterium]HNC68890.1 OsmC family protein [Pseudomonadales bacterium]
MHRFPHRYVVDALATPGSSVTVRSPDLEDIQSTAPPEFGGPEGNWSPETLFVAAVADCYVLSFRAVANASRFDWSEIDCEAVGVLDRTDEGLWFTQIELQVKLRIPAGGDAGLGTRLLEKAERNCLVSKSLRSETLLRTEVVVG